MQESEWRIAHRIGTDVTVSQAHDIEKYEIAVELPRQLKQIHSEVCDGNELKKQMQAKASRRRRQVQYYPNELATKCESKKAKRIAEMASKFNASASKKRQEVTPLCEVRVLLQD